MRRQSGFTLAELMIGLAVAGITVSVGVPSFSNFMATQAQTAATNDFVMALSLARSEAIKQSRHITVCRSQTGAQCEAGTDWGVGWIVFANTAAGNAGVLDPGETVLRRFSGQGGDREIEPNVAGLNFVSFRPVGTVNAAAVWTLCDHRGPAYSRAVIVDRAGRARAVHPAPDPDACELPGGS